MPHEDLTKLNLEELSTRTGQSGSQQNFWIELEFGRRQTVAQQQAAEAQERAAKAAEETATYTQRNARYMLWSVVVLTASSIASFIIALLTYLN